MYIAQVGDQYIVKRMPLSGGGHDPSCPSYEPPDELSGLGVLMGSAIQVDPESGMAALKAGFQSVEGWRPGCAGCRTSASDSVAGDTKKLSLRSLLHYLWHEAELTVWTSRWAGKRHWWNIRWHLIEAASQMTVKGGPLSEVLFVPEPFRSADKAAIEQRRTAALAPALPPKSGPRKLMILVGEVKEFAPARSGHSLIVKHMPGFLFLLDERLYRRLQARFENELALWGADEASHLMAIATFGLTPAGLAVVEEMALMVVAENWVPYESAYEKRLVDALAKLRDRSVKGLRYNLSAETANRGCNSAASIAADRALCRSAFSGQRLRGSAGRTDHVTAGDRCLDLAHGGGRDTSPALPVNIARRSSRLLVHLGRLAVRALSTGSKSPNSSSSFQAGSYSIFARAIGNCALQYARCRV